MNRQTPIAVQGILQMALEHDSELELHVDGVKQPGLQDWAQAAGVWEHADDPWAGGSPMVLRRADGEALTTGDLENLLDIICFMLDPMDEDVPQELRDSLDYQSTVYRAMFLAIEALRADIAVMHANGA